MKKFIYISVLVFLAVATGCGKKSDEPVPPLPPPVEANRTILVYMAAYNDLGTAYYDISDLNEMVKFTAENPTFGGHLVVYHASTKGVVLKEIKSNKIDTLKVYDTDKSSVSVSRMREVIKDTKELAPAKDYGIIFWSHASGWIQDGLEQNSPKMYSYGAEGIYNPSKPYRTMNTTSLAEATEDAGFSFMYFDCCYMSTVEVMYELRNCSSYIVASPTEDPGDGMPYHLTLPYLFDTTRTMEDATTMAAKTTFEHYNSHFKEGDCPCTMTVVKTDGIDGLAEATRNVFTVAETSYNPLYSYQHFDGTNKQFYFDLEQYIESICTDPQLFAQWKEALNSVVVYRDYTPFIWNSTRPIERCCGLSTYILKNEQESTSNGYNTLSWYSDVVFKLFN